MIVLQETTSSQTIKFIPRKFTSGNTCTVKIVSESTGTEVYSASTTSITENLYYNQYSSTILKSAASALKENNFYLLTITDTTLGEIIYKGKIFCTNQTLPNYTVNSGQYTSNSSNNDFIFI
tara:strand:- start:929 stop:1294 length:366 start_codon:yes stop_codon:yes gene_type:complete